MTTNQPRSDTSGPVRLALIGCGRVAQRVHAPILASIDGAELSAVVDPSADAKNAARRSRPTVELYDSPAPALERADIDAVVIALPTGMHAAAAEAAFAAGKAVYIEKPLAASARDADRVVRAHESAGTVGMTGFNYRYHPLHQRATRLIADGKIGSIVAIRSAFTTPARELPAWKKAVASGGGVMLDLLSHHADLAAFYTGSRVTRASAVRRSVLSEGDNAAATLVLGSGVVAQCTVSMTGTEQDRFEIIGDAGTIIVDRFRNTLTVVPLRHSATTPEMTARSLGLAAQSLRSLRPAMDPSYRPALEAFVRSVRTGSLAEGDPGIADGWHSLAAVLAAEHSARRDAQTIAVPASPAEAQAIDTPEPEETQQQQQAAADPPEDNTPAISVVLVTINTVRSLDKVMHHLRQQTIAPKTEILIVGPNDEAFADLSDDDRGPLMRVTPVIAGEITDVDMSSALALAEAKAPYIAFLEDHAFPEPNWAETIVDAFDTFGTAGIGTAIENGNPCTVLSWANMLMSYGEWVAAQHAGPTLSVSRHNVAFKADVLRREYGEGLPHMMGRDGGLLGDLVARGHGYAIDPATHVRHLNPSTWSSTLELRIGSGRLFASSRMKRERWSNAKRWLYILGAPAIPFIRYRLLREALIGPGSDARRKRIGDKVVAALIVGCTLDGIGQLLGHAFGPGTVKEKLAFFEMGRARHLVKAEKHLMTDPDA
ncbi:MAG: Gfo/Idh/MocA family oxidoreductase [Planctomycetota bacterium]